MVASLIGQDCSKRLLVCLPVLQERHSDWLMSSSMWNPKVVLTVFTHRIPVILSSFVLCIVCVCRFKFSTSGSVDASASGISSTVTMAMGEFAVFCVCVCDVCVCVCVCVRACVHACMFPQMNILMVVKAHA